MVNRGFLFLAFYGYWSLLSSWITCSNGLHVIPGYENEKACYGTSDGIGLAAEIEGRYQKYKEMYTNCTYVTSNLEIVALNEPGVVYDMSFLSQIKEVTGYVLIALNSIDYIPLTALRIIRGSFLYEYQNDSYSLFVTLNYDHNYGPLGLKELRLKNLSEILAGKVFFKNNDQLCFEDTIDWKDINYRIEPPVTFMSDTKGPKRQCGSCHEKCYNDVTKRRHCWGEGPAMCQTLSHGSVCHGNCVGNRCYGDLPNQCCHPDCAGGCTGPLKTDCFACLYYKDGNECVPHCPKDKIYDKTKMINIDNPEVKFQFGSVCVRECPAFMLQDGNSCVRQCAEGSYAPDQRLCKPCNGPCPKKKCKGFDKNSFLNSNNSIDFVDCTEIEGDLIILTTSFVRDDHYGIEPLHPHNLTILKSVREISGYLLIQSKHPEFTNLDFLSNLEIIHGRTSTENSGRSISIIATPLQSLELVSLKKIQNGNVLIVSNENLCYADTIKWNELFLLPSQYSIVINNRKNESCEKDGLVCDPQCGDKGCWGKGPNKCFKCANYVYEEESWCLNKCSDRPRLYHEAEGKCKLCHVECANTCSGPNNTDCDSCIHVVMKDKAGRVSCEASCGAGMYPDENQVCQPCHPNCGQNGCNGPSEVVGPQGCKACDIGIRERPDYEVKCLPDGTRCQDGYHLGFSPSTSDGRLFPVCEKCHEYCTTCTGPTQQFCIECRYFRDDKYCVNDCESNFKYGNTDTKTCEPCDSQCRSRCMGPTSTDCFACANFKIYLEMENKTFNCTPECPPHLPYRVKEQAMDENRVVCADATHPEVDASRSHNLEKDETKLRIILGVTVPLAVIAFGAVIFFTFLCYKRAQNNRKAAEYTAKIAGVEEIEPLTPTNAKPDLAQMRIISEEELRRGAIIGSGAFGTVYKGIWIPHGENVKIPVAIKVLQEGTSPGQSTELLEEARVMCSVDNMCCVRILAICMKSEMMLVTQLMPHGNLLNYVRTNAQHIGSKALLNWCTQIARGMAYLEERGIVHRDLAARNVLVQTPNQVKITDFGLAKLLDSDSLEYHSSGGLMPIKWLALECILHRIFTHKSDVWSYGITIWELFTLGKKPYDGVRTKDVPILLEKGERLQQPMICTIDVYMIMVKCWMLDAESRPSFKELQEEFAKMSRDPGRYLVIEGDSLMRLPSVSYDKNELVNGISADGSENVMEAEEYLSPMEQHLQPRPHSMRMSYERQHSNRSNVSAGGLSRGHSNERFKANNSDRHSDQIRDTKYSHLSAAARAKQSRELPSPNRDSSRYSSDPIKFIRDRDDVEWFQAGSQDLNGDSLWHYPQQPKSGRNSRVMQGAILPVDEEDYLRPGAAAAAAQSLAYLDLDGKGYYKNEKEAVVDDEDEDPFSNEMEQMLDHLAETTPESMNSNNNKHFYVTNAGPVTAPAVANPDYFENDADVWKYKNSSHNGYHPIPSAVVSPVHHYNNNNKNPNSPSNGKTNNSASPSFGSSQQRQSVTT